MSTSRTRLRIAFAVAVAAALAASPASAQEGLFPKGSFSAGAFGGYALFSMGQINDQIRVINTLNGTDFDELDSGWDYGGDVRYAITNSYFLGFEVGRLQGETNEDQGVRFQASGTPVVLIGGGSVGNADDGIAFRILGGLGAVTGATFETPGVGEVSGSGFLFQLGGEFEIRPARGFGATAQLMVRQAKVSNPDGAPYDIDFSGGSGRLGVRVYFGG